MILAGENERKLELVRSRFPELAAWHPDPRKDFTHAQLLSDKTPLIIVNLVEGSLDKVLESPLEMR